MALIDVLTGQGGGAPGGFDPMTQQDLARRDAALQAVMSMPLSSLRAKADLQRGEQFKESVGKAALGMWSPTPGMPTAGGASPVPVGPGAVAGQPPMAPPQPSMPMAPAAGPTAGGGLPQLTIMTEREFVAQTRPEVIGKPLIDKRLRDELRLAYADYVQRQQLLFGAEMDRVRTASDLEARSATGAPSYPSNVEELLARSLAGEQYDPAAISAAQAMFDRKHATGGASAPSTVEGVLARSLMDPGSVPPGAQDQATRFLERGKRSLTAEEQAEQEAWNELKKSPGTALERLQKLTSATQGEERGPTMVTAQVVNEALHGDGVLRDGLIKDLKTARDANDPAGVVTAWGSMQEWQQVTGKLEPRMSDRLRQVVDQFRPTPAEVTAAYDAGAFGPTKPGTLWGPGDEDVANTRRRFMEFLSRWGDEATVARFQAMSGDEGDYQAAGTASSLN